MASTNQRCGVKAAAVIVAAGASRRFGARTAKQFYPLCGRPVFLWSILAFRKAKSFRQVILVVPRAAMKKLYPYQKKYGFELAEGGRERVDSVRAGLAKVTPDIDFVAIHDGARPLITPAGIRRLLAAAVRYKAVIPATPVTDTVKLADPKLTIIKTVPRQNLWAVQTPQIFRRSLLLKAYSRIKGEGLTDDAQVLERAGFKVKLVPGDKRNIKITERKDLKTAESRLKSKE